jgi:mRNA-degrading endonuclease RelE of RelBE toxin-antitoxin system
LALNIKFSTTAAKYLAALDKTTRNRIVDKLQQIAETPLDLRLSYPLVGKTKRSSRVGDYRILFQVEEKDLVVADIGPRGQIYRKA